MRSKKKIPWNDCYYQEAYVLASLGKSNDEIASFIGASVELFATWMQDRPALRRALRDGRRECDFSRYTRSLSPLQCRFLAAYAECGLVTHAAEAASMTHDHHSRWMRTDKLYARAFNAVKEKANDALEFEARRRAVAGSRRYKFFKGQPVLIPCEKNDPDAIEVENNNGETVYVKHYYELDYSDTLLALLLKAKRPDEFRETPTSVNIDNSTTNELTGDTLIMHLADQAETPVVVDAEFVNKEATRLITSLNMEELNDEASATDSPEKELVRKRKVKRTRRRS